MFSRDEIAAVAIVIIGYQNPADICDCLLAASNASLEPAFDIFICENGGKLSYQRLLQTLLDPGGPCVIAEPTTPIPINPERLSEIECLSLKNRQSKVWVARAFDNLGYAGGLNAWLSELEQALGWKGIWLLNPDTIPAVDALAELVRHAEAHNKGMVGSSLFDTARPTEIRCRGGLNWQKFKARAVAIGLGDSVETACDPSSIEAALDSPSGASMYVTRSCLQRIGNMDETYFLFFEDLDWGIRAKSQGLGYAARSLVGHKRGTTTGSAKRLAEVPKLSLYLEHRNGIHFVRKFFPRTIPNRIVYSLLSAMRLLALGAPDRSWVVLQAIIAGLKGERGRPTQFRDLGHVES